jgi:hypothetical protein
MSDDSTEAWWEQESHKEADAAEKEEREAHSLHRLVVLRGGTELTPEQCKAALDEAMTIIEAVGTTGIYSRYQKAYEWMHRYYPAWE